MCGPSILFGHFRDRRKPEPPCPEWLDARLLRQRRVVVCRAGSLLLLVRLSMPNSQPEFCRDSFAGNQPSAPFRLARPVHPSADCSDKTFAWPVRKRFLLYSLLPARHRSPFPVEFYCPQVTARASRSCLRCDSGRNRRGPALAADSHSRRSAVPIAPLAGRAAAVGRGLVLREFPPVARKPAC